MYDQGTREYQRYQDLMGKIHSDKGIVLSASALKQFSKSPRTFVKYKCEERQPAGEDAKLGMMMESLIDLAVNHGIEPSYRSIKPLLSELKTMVDWPFCVFDINDRPVKDISKTTGKPYTMTQKDNAMWKRALLRTHGENLVSVFALYTALDMAAAVLRHEKCLEILDGATFQHKQWTTIDGIRFVCYLDVYKKGFISDFKKCKDAHYDRFRYDFKSLGRQYDLQLAVYDIAMGRDNNCSLIAVDPTPMVNFFRISDRTMMEAKRKVGNLIKDFKRCAEEDLWHQGYEFYGFEGGWTI